ncbi:hypothetical protein J5N58_05375 [Rhizobium cremeum]|uniref:hypothetical protein n=1 Tax=Rhizobium cremeum TaxID=2813827 RepID=UPI000DDB9F1D|nr:hypothetical protein [Rhizobium cremeum]MCJ7994047.1 hypothetical protein [Rhizobium cremeum]MCJ7999104.1 hypothetical protein [Rhizobium cremeum]
MKKTTVVALLACATTLSACYSSGPRPLPAVSQAPTVEGNWMDQNGLVSTFSAGRLETRTTDGSNKVMATGTYMMEGANLVQITLYSNLKQTTTKAACALVTPTQLNCTSDTGAQFSLNRQV